jgi:hypothetical protein
VTFVAQLFDHLALPLIPVDISVLESPNQLDQARQRRHRSKPDRRLLPTPKNLGAVA